MTEPLPDPLLPLFVVFEADVVDAVVVVELPPQMCT
jgi:hypothetical protein